MTTRIVIASALGLATSVTGYANCGGPVFTSSSCTTTFAQRTIMLTFEELSNLCECRVNSIGSQRGSGGTTFDVSLRYGTNFSATYSTTLSAASRDLNGNSDREDNCTYDNNEMTTAPPVEDEFGNALGSPFPKRCISSTGLTDVTGIEAQARSAASIIADNGTISSGPYIKNRLQSGISNISYPDDFYVDSVVGPSSVQWGAGAASFSAYTELTDDGDQARFGSWSSVRGEDVVTFSLTPSMTDDTLLEVDAFGRGTFWYVNSMDYTTVNNECKCDFSGTGTSDAVVGRLYAKYTVVSSDGPAFTFIARGTSNNGIVSVAIFGDHNVVSNDSTCGASEIRELCPGSGIQEATKEQSCSQGFFMSPNRKFARLNLGRPTSVTLTRSVYISGGPNSPLFAGLDSVPGCGFQDRAAIVSLIVASGTGTVPETSPDYDPVADLDFDGDIDDDDLTFFDNSGGSNGICCPGDWNGDGVTSVSDNLDYLNAWSAGDPSADIDADGILAVGDILDWTSIWSSDDCDISCP